nr:hypothetical protein [Leptolyngbya sp. 7M]
MVSYALKQAPEIILEVPGRDSRKQRQQALDQLVDRANEDEALRAKLATWNRPFTSGISRTAHAPFHPYAKQAMPSKLSRTI